MTTTANAFVVPDRFSKPLGFRKDGRPFYLIGGGSIMGHEEIPSAPTSQQQETQAPAAPEYRFTAADIEEARRQEKDKVYGRLDSVAEQNKVLQQQIQALLDEQNARKEAEEAARREAEEAARRAAEAELSTTELLAQRQREYDERLQQQASDWERKFEQMAQERAQEAAILEKEREMAALAAYTQQRLAQEQGNIAPQLLDFIDGNTPAEVDAAIEKAKAKSAEIIAAIQEQQVQQRAQQRGVAPTGYSAAGPMEVEGGTRTYSDEDIRAMSVQEYAKFRQQVGIGGAGAGRGLFG